MNILRLFSLSGDVGTTEVDLYLSHVNGCYCWLLTALDISTSLFLVLCCGWLVWCVDVSVCQATGAWLTNHFFAFLLLCCLEPKDLCCAGWVALNSYCCYTVLWNTWCCALRLDKSAAGARLILSLNLPLDQHSLFCLPTMWTESSCRRIRADQSSRIAVSHGLEHGLGKDVGMKWEVRWCYGYIPCHFALCPWLV